MLAFAALLACVGCGDDPGPGALGPASGASGVSGTSGTSGGAGAPGGAGGAGGEVGMSGNSGQSGASGEAGAGGVAGASGQAGAPGGAAGVGGGGAAGATGGQGGTAACAETSDCGPHEGPCLVCSAGAYVCPEVACVGGLCVESTPNCDGVVGCEPVVAHGVGACGLPLGWVWGGASCELLTGCTCEGEGCGQVAATKAGCEAGRSSCVPPGLVCAGKACGAPCSPCPPWEKCEPSPFVCGFTGLCGDKSEQCPMCQLDAECIAPPSFSCPGGSKVVPTAFCEGGLCTSSSEECPALDPCGDTSLGVGATPGCVEKFHGFAWKEGACVEVIACTCDCKLVAPTWDECFSKHSTCPQRACQSDADCPAVTHCSSCPDGSAACPAAQCLGGSCAYLPGLCP